MSLSLPDRNYFFAPYGAKLCEAFTHRNGEAVGFPVPVFGCARKK